ncbi:unnamed protein product [Rodentolepis nana]|uniref:GIT domain-containing protein n=1 Tax=Rodentolepis nana TaxID=102285 RepID=A0A0R3TK32_RODNA|nr:unnamed protein product [Rodentolepis nana]
MGPSFSDVDDILESAPTYEDLSDLEYERNSLGSRKIHHKINPNGRQDHHAIPDASPGRHQDYKSGQSGGKVSANLVNGLIDCLDPDCCGTDHCEKLIRLRGNLQQVVEDALQSCAHSTEISSLILSTKLPPPGSSFYDQLEFLLLRDLTTDKVDPRPRV